MGQQQEFEHQQRQLVLQQQQHLQEQQILSKHVQRHQQQHQFQVQQNQLKNQIQRLLLEELPQNEQLIDSLTEKTYEVALSVGVLSAPVNLTSIRKKKS